MSVQRWTVCVSNDESVWFEPRGIPGPESDSEIVLASDYERLRAALQYLLSATTSADGLSDLECADRYEDAAAMARAELAPQEKQT
jgi:hypothetical protein